MPDHRRVSISEGVRNVAAPRFVGLIQVYRRVGYRLTHDYRYLGEYARRFREVILLRENIAGALRARGEAVHRESRTVLRLNGTLRIAVMLGRCRMKDDDTQAPGASSSTAVPGQQWVLAACLAPDGASVQQYWLQHGAPNASLFGGTYYGRHERHRSPTIDPLLDLLVHEAG